MNKECKVLVRLNLFRCKTKNKCLLTAGILYASEKKNAKFRSKSKTNKTRFREQSNIWTHTGSSLRNYPYGDNPYGDKAEVASNFEIWFLFRGIYYSRYQNSYVVGDLEAWLQMAFVGIVLRMYCQEGLLQVHLKTSPC